MLLAQFQMDSPLGQQLAVSELDNSRRFVGQLADYREEDRATFPTIVTACLLHGLTQGKLADEFRVSTATISRWAKGKSMPPAYSRGNIVSRIRQLILNEIEEAEPLIQRRAAG